MLLKTSALVAASLACGFFLGRLGPAKTSVVEFSAPVRSQNHPRPIPRKTARQTARETAPDLATLARLSRVDGDPLVIVPASLLAHGTSRPSISDHFFSGDGVAEAALQITENEKTAVQSAWRTARSRIQELEVSRSTSRELDDGSVRIAVPDLSGQIESIASRFETAATGILGENRCNALLASKRVAEYFRSESGGGMLHVSVESTGDGHWRYRIESARATAGRQMWVGESMPPAIRHLTDAARIPPTLNAVAGAAGE